jgi:hypothetical protein
MLLFICLSGCSKKSTEPKDTVTIPMYNLQAGTFTTPKLVSINCETPGVVIRFTIDGEIPNTRSTIYTSPIDVDSTLTINAIAFKKGWNPSQIATATYSFHISVPELNLNPGYYLNPQTVSISCNTPEAIIRYTLNNAIPDYNSTIYTTPIPVESDLTIKAIAYKAGWTPSPMISGIYNIYHIPPEQERYITSLTASPDTIYADNGITFSTLKATVKDGNNAPVVGMTVKFTTNLGRVLTNVTTNNLGVAQSVLWDEGNTGHATIWATANNYSEDNPDSLISGDTKSIEVTIAGVPPISSISLEMPSNLSPFPMNLMQSITISARVRNILGNDIADNSLVVFSSTRGYFADAEGISLGNEVVIPTVNGRATIIFNAGTEAGSGTITARISDRMSIRNIVVNP